MTNPATATINRKSEKLIYAVGAPHCAPPSVQWFARQRGHQVKLFADLNACRLAMRNRPRPRLVAIVVGSQTDQVVDFVYQIRTDPGLVASQLLLLADEDCLIELMALLQGVTGVDFAAPASSPEFLQARVQYLLQLPAVDTQQSGSPVRLQIVDSVMSRLINSRRRSEMELSRFQRVLDIAVGALMLFDSKTLACVYCNDLAMREFSVSGVSDGTAISLADLMVEKNHAQKVKQLELLASGQIALISIPAVQGDYRNGDIPEGQLELRFFEDPRVGGLFVVSFSASDPSLDYSLQTQHDLLTGLPNRRLFLDRVAEAISQAKHSDHVFGLLVMDLDRFKDVNDSLGHDVGDELLNQIGQTLIDSTEQSDAVARLGDDDFAVLFSEQLDRPAVRAKADEIAGAVQGRFLVKGHKLEITAGLGIVHYPQDGDDGETLLRRAQVATDLAKRDGLGVVAFESHMDQTHQDQLTLKADLRQAILTDQLFLHYQPKVRITDGSCVGVEALSRWVHPERGFIPPDEFVALAERAGLIKNLTRWVITQAVEQSARWRDSGNSLCIAVNLSAKNLQEPDLVEFVKNSLGQYSLPPSALQFELTESDIMADPETAIAMIEELHRFGIEFAVDDYGTGYSSLAYLKKLRISELKIDKGFIGQLNCAGDDMVIVHSTITMAHQLGIRVVAEGVEDQEIWDLLDVLECDIAQGYLISRPVSARDLDKAMKNGLTSHIR